MQQDDPHLQVLRFVDAWPCFDPTRHTLLQAASTHIADHGTQQGLGVTLGLQTLSKCLWYCEIKSLIRNIQYI